MNLYVVIDPTNSLYWVWAGTEDQAINGTRTRVSPQGWDHEEDAKTWAQGFSEGVSWATAVVKTDLELTLELIGRKLAMT